MKYIIILFSLYLVALSLIPCGDESDVSVVKQTRYSSQTDPMGDEHDILDDCAAFCSCNCCSFGKNFPSQITAKRIESVAQLTYALSTVFAVEKQSVAIWQPPKES